MLKLLQKCSSLLNDSETSLSQLLFFSFSPQFSTHIPTSPHVEVINGGFAWCLAKKEKKLSFFYGLLHSQLMAANLNTVPRVPCRIVSIQLQQGVFCVQETKSKSKNKGTTLQTLNNSTSDCSARAPRVFFVSHHK